MLKSFESGVRRLLRLAWGFVGLQRRQLEDARCVSPGSGEADTSGFRVEDLGVRVSGSGSLGFRV